MTDLVPATGTAAAFPAGESARIRAEIPKLWGTGGEVRGVG